MLGGAGLAAELSAVSADHLLHASDADICAMADKGVAVSYTHLDVYKRQVSVCALHVYSGNFRTLLYG